MNRIFRVRYIVALVVINVALAFPYGPLFPWSPVRPGYTEQRFERATVIYPAEMQLSDAYRHVDEYIDRAERFHLLRIKSRVKVILCRNWSDVRRMVLDPRSQKVAGATYPTGTVIFITPKIAEQRLDSGEFIRHELSHAVLNQNQTVLSSVRMARHQWFAEGLAVSFGEQKAFITPDEFVSYAQANDLENMIDPEQWVRGKNMRVAYQCWRYFLEHLIESRGRDRFQRYMTAYMASPGTYRELFIQSYGMSFPQAVAQFQQQVRAGLWKPNPAFVEGQIR